MLARGLVRLVGRLVERVDRPVRWMLMLLVLLVGAGAFVVALRGSSSPAYVGHRWELVKLVHGGEGVPLPEGKRASVSYPSRSRVFMEDLVNSSDATFTVTGRGYTTSNSSSTTKGYAGTDPRVPVLIAAMRPLTATGAERAEVSGGHLTLQVDGYVFTFDDAGSAK